jgi:2-iminoacetate synthase
LATLEEYLLDFAGPELRAAGEAHIADDWRKLDGVDRRRAERMLAALRAGRRDVYC